VDLVAREVDGALGPDKLNYEIHGNTIPHLHLHLFPRRPGDRFEGIPIDGREAIARTEADLAALRTALTPLQATASDPATDPYAPLKDNAWRQTADIDGRLQRGEIDEAGWHAEIARLIVPAYLAADTPWQGSGKSGTAEDWEYARSHIAHAIDRDSSILDVGCANGYLLECLPRWTPHRLDRYGLDIAPELVELARRRLPEMAERLWVGNALHWEPPHRFTFIRTGLEYVPRHRRADLIERLLGWCERLIIGVFNEETDARPTEELLRSWGYTIAGRSERANHKKPGIDYRVLWIDAKALKDTTSAPT
jgi:SAM-dependent methyltransferase